MPALIGDLATLVEFGGALVIALYAVATLFRLMRGRVGIDAARLLLTSGVLSALGFKLAASILRTAELQTWNDIGMAFAVLGLRTLVKQAMRWDEARMSRRAG